MRNLQATFETCKWSFVSAFSICMTVPLRWEGQQMSDTYYLWYLWLEVQKYPFVDVLSSGNFGIHQRLRNCNLCIYKFLNVFEFVNGNI